MLRRLLRSSLGSMMVDLFFEVTYLSFLPIDCPLQFLHYGLLNPFKPFDLVLHMPQLLELSLLLSLALVHDVKNKLAFHATLMLLHLFLLFLSLLSPDPVSLDGPPELLLYLLPSRCFLLTNHNSYFLLLPRNFFLDLAGPLLLQASLVHNFDLLHFNLNDL